MGKPNAGAQLFANTGGGQTAPTVPAAAGTSAGARLFHGAAPAQPAEKPQPHHHGLLGSIVHEAGHVVGQTASDLEHAAINTPAGLYQLGKAGVEAASGHPQDAINLGKAYVHGVVQDVEHPLRHPGFTLLDALSVVDLAGGAVGRVAAIGKAVEAGGTAGDLIKAGVKRPAMGTRTLRSGDLKVHPETSPSFVGSRVQKLTDKALQNAADKNRSGRAAQLLNRKIGKTVTAEARQATRNARGPAQALLKIGRRLKPGEQKALQVVAEQAPLEQRITAASARVTGARDALVRGRHQGELDLLHEAKPHLTVDAAGKPALAEPRLQAVYAKMATVAGDREALLKSLGLLTDESIKSRTTEAARISLGGHYVTAGEARDAANKAGAAGHAVENQIEKQAGATSRFAARAANRVEKQATSAEGKAFAAGTTRTGVERDALAAAAKADRAAAKASSERFAHGPRAAEGENVARLLQREQRLAQIVYERFQRGEVGPGAVDRSQRRLATLSDRWEKLAPSTLKVRDARAVGDAAAQEQEAQIARLRGAEAHATAAHEAAQANASMLRRSAKGAVQIREAVARANDAKVTAARATTERAMAEELARANRIVGADHFTADENAVRIPDVATKKGSKALHTQATVGAQGTIGHLKEPGSVTHGYTGALREHGLRRQDTTTLVAESGLEAAKYAGLRHIHQLVRQAVTATPTRPDDIAVRLDELGSHDKLPHEVRKFLADPEEYFKASTPAEQASMLDKARQMHFFPGEDKGGGWKVDAKADPAAAAEFERLHAAGKIGFVPRRILGELGNPTAPLRAVAPGKAVGTVDAINNASRFAILYLKPAYALPNVLGNAALGLIQQGFAAPRNLAQAARIVQRLPEGDYQRIDAAMGEGLARAASAHGAGRMSAVVDKAANVWSSAVDTPFRRAAFLHEARQAGYKTPAQIHQLLGRDAHDPELIRVGIKSNRDAIDYENLSNREKEIVRRVVFFYPWIKGSTVYAGRFVRDHPTTAAVAAQVGRQGQQFSQQGVGRMPSYLEGLIPTGKDTVSNPTSAAILQTPAQIGMALQGLASGNIPEAAAASNFITPALSLALAEGLRTNPSTGAAYKPGTNAGAVAENVLGNNLPQVTLYKALHAALTGSGGSKLYPPSIRSALTQFLAGSIAPRKIDKQDLERLYALEQRKMKYGR